MEIIWTKLARITYIEVLENLNMRWTIKEMKTFRQLTDNVLKSIVNQEVDFLIVNNQLGIKKAIIHKNVSVYFIKENETLPHHILQ